MQSRCSPRTTANGSRLIAGHHERRCRIGLRIIIAVDPIADAGLRAILNPPADLCHRFDTGIARYLFAGLALPGLAAAGIPGSPDLSVAGKNRGPILSDSGQVRCFAILCGYRSCRQQGQQCQSEAVHDKFLSNEADDTGGFCALRRHNTMVRNFRTGNRPIAVSG